MDARFGMAITVLLLAGCLGAPPGGLDGETSDNADGAAGSQGEEDGADGSRDGRQADDGGLPVGDGDRAADGAQGDASAPGSEGDDDADDETTSGGQDGTSSPEGNSTTGTPNATSHQITWRSLDQGAWSAYPTSGPQAVVADSNASWASLWSQHQAGNDPPAARPAVDMATEVVVALFLGTQKDTGHEVEVMDVVWNGTDWEVHYEATDHGGNGCMTGQAQTDPYHFIAVERSAPTPAASLWMDALVVNDCS